MAGSRLEKLGTIFTRVTGLIKSGAMKVDDRPIWYDVYRAFPPESEPHYAKPAKPINVPNVFYREDTFRAEFHKRVRNQLPTIDLREVTQKTPDATKAALDLYAADESISVDQVIDTLKRKRVIQDYNTSTRTFDSDKSAKKSNIALEFLSHSTTAQPKTPSS